MARESNLPPGFSSLTPAEQRAYLAQRRQLLLGFGDQTLARRIIGLPNDPLYGQISSGPNSLSTLGQLGRTYGQNVAAQNQAMGNLQTQNAQNVLSADEAANARNLYYSSARALAQKQLATTFAQNKGKITQNLANLGYGYAANKASALAKLEDSLNKLYDQYSRSVAAGSSAGSSAGSGAPVPKPKAVQSDELAGGLVPYHSPYLYAASRGKRTGPYPLPASAKKKRSTRGKRYAGHGPAVV